MSGYWQQATGGKVPQGFYARQALYRLEHAWRLGWPEERWEPLIKTAVAGAGLRLEERPP